MALTRILGISASSLTGQFIGKQRYNHHCSTLFSAIFMTCKIIPKNNSFPSIFHYSSFSDLKLPEEFRNLVSEMERAFKNPRPMSELFETIESDIKHAEENGYDKVPVIPEGFPFKIEDKYQEKTIYLSREYQDETITVKVKAPRVFSAEDDYEIEEEYNEECRLDQDYYEVSQRENDTKENIQLEMVVRVSKKRGPCFKFALTAYPDEILINGLSVKDSEIEEISDDQLPYPGPTRFNDLDENGQKAFLEIRGITSSTTNFLYEYMVKKEKRDDLESSKEFMKSRSLMCGSHGRSK